MKSILSLLVSLILSINILSAQDILGGETKLIHLSGTTYIIETFLYTRTDMGIQHQGNPTNFSNNITEWYSIATHSFPGSGMYEINYTDSFRISGIQNIINSHDEKIILKASTTINPFAGINSSPAFTFKQNELFTDGNNIFFDASGIDPDGDSLVYNLVPATSSNYSFVVGASITQNTGFFAMPVQAGPAVINIEVKEYRLGYLVGITYREMTIDSSLVTSHNELSGDTSSFQIFPNPTTGTINIKCEKEIQQVIIYSMTGGVIAKFEKPDKIIDLGDYKNGIYILMINDQKGNIYRTLLYKI